MLHPCSILIAKRIALLIVLRCPVGYKSYGGSLPSCLAPEWMISARGVWSTHGKRVTYGTSHPHHTRIPKLSTTTEPASACTRQRTWARLDITGKQRVVLVVVKLPYAKHDVSLFTVTQVTVVRSRVEETRQLNRVVNLRIARRMTPAYRRSERTWGKKSTQTKEDRADKPPSVPPACVIWREAA